MNGMVVESIVRIDDVAEARRALKEVKGDALGDNYMVKG